MQQPFDAEQPQSLHGRGGAASVLALQRMAGNRQVARIAAGALPFSPRSAAPGTSTGSPPVQSSQAKPVAGDAQATTSADPAPTGPGVYVQVTSKIQAFKGWIACQSFSFGTSTPNSGGQATGAHQNAPFVLTKSPDATTPKWMAAEDDNEVLESVVIQVNSAGGSSQTITLKNALVVDWNEAGGGGGVSEKITLTYQTIEIAVGNNSTTTADSWNK